MSFHVKIIDAKIMPLCVICLYSFTNMHNKHVNARAFDLKERRHAAQQMCFSYLAHGQFKSTMHDY